MRCKAIVRFWGGERVRPDIRPTGGSVVKPTSTGGAGSTREQQTPSADGISPADQLRLAIFLNVHRFSSLHAICQPGIRK